MSEITDTKPPEQAASPTRPTRRWIKRLLIALLVTVALVLLVAVGGFQWLTRTTSGANLALGQAQGVLNELNWSSSSGNLRDGLVLENLSLRQAGASVDIERIELAAQLRLFGGPELIIERLLVRNADVVLPPPTETSEPDAPIVIPDLSSPVPVQVDQLGLVNVRVFQHQAESPLVTVDQLDLAGRYGQSLVLDRFELRLPQGRFSASGDAGLGAPHSLALEARATTALDALPEHQIALSVNGPLNDLAIEISTIGPAELSGPIQLRGLPELENLSIELQGQFADWPELDYAARELDITARGSPNDWVARISTRVEGPQLPENLIQIDATGGLEQARLQSLRITTLDGEITAQGQASWADALAGELSVALEQLDLTSLYADLPAQARLNGALNVSLANEAIVLNSLTLRAPPTTLSLVGSGRYDPASDDLALDVVWQDFSWPPVTDDAKPLIASERGEIKLSGQLSDWQAELDALLQVPDRPDAQIEAALRGSESSALIESLQLDAAQAGRARLQGELSWQPELQAQLSAELIDLDPAEFLRQLPGRVSAQVDVSLNSLQDITLAINQLSGTLRGQNVSGGGRVHWMVDAPEAGRLDLAIGDNRIELDSTDGRRWAFSARGDALDQLWPGLSGVLVAEGEISPVTGELTLGASIRAGGLNDVTLSELDLNAELRWLQPTRTDVVLTLKDLDLNPWERIDQLELTLGGGCRAHSFGLNFNAQHASLDLAGQGQWPGCLRGGQRWDAAIERLFIGDTPAGNWQLREPLKLVAEPEAVTLEAACLEAAGQEPGSVCLRSARLAPAGQASSAQIQLADVPMDLILLPLDPTVSLSTPLSAELDAGWTVGEGLDRLGGFLALGAGALTPLGADRALMDIGGVRLDLEPSNGGVLAKLNAQFEGNSRLSATVGIDDLRQPDQSTVNGQLSLDLPDIGVFNRAVAELDSLEGRLQGEMAIRGRLGAPQLEGQASLVDGGLRHAPLGLDVQDIQLNLNGSNLLATLTGQMRSGDGRLALNGELRPSGEYWAWNLALDGEQFSVAGTDWLKLAISPDIEIGGAGSRMTIDGNVRIDSLDAGLPPGQAARVNASDDVVVLGETDQDQESKPLLMTGRLGIDLGEQSRLAAAGLETTLAGQIELLWDENEALPRSRGIVRLPKGSFEAYGQNLLIEGGEVILSNHPITNPRLDIEAVRDIFGDAQVERAGVSIRGNAQSPEIRLFTDPPTSEEKALAYVVTGADFDHAGGQGAVNVGLYLLPKLFVSYGIGLFENGNVLSGRYELSRRWGVRVVSGERDTGVDLSYAVDK